MRGWYGIDLDGTLAFYDEWRGEEHIGDPIPAMAERVRKMLDEGLDVRIFTARADGGVAAENMGVDGTAFRDVDRIVGIVQDWTEKHFGVRLPVTCKKDFGCIAIYDDRAIRIVKNEGVPCCDHE